MFAFQTGDEGRGSGTHSGLVPSRGGPAGGSTSPGSGRSILVLGTSRTLVNLLVYGLAERESPSFHWLVIRAPGDPEPDHDPVSLGWVPSDRVWATSLLEELAPDDARANAALFELVREEEPSATLMRLAEFLRLPPTIQRILQEIQTSGSPTVLAVANADRVAGTFSETTLPAILDAFREVGCSVVVGSSHVTSTLAPHFTHVLRIRGEALPAWREAELVLQRGVPFAGLRTEQPVALSSLGFAARVYARATGSVD